MDAGGWGIGCDAPRRDTVGQHVGLQSQDKAAASRAQVLEMLGDLPDADLPPPENVLFVCKLNPVTEDEDLEIIFGR